jgi:hypothetical protein
MLRERYIWSVFPSLAAWPILHMETAPGSLLVSLLLVREGGGRGGDSRARCKGEVGKEDWGSALLLARLLAGACTAVPVVLVIYMMLSADAGCCRACHPEHAA